MEMLSVRLAVPIICPPSPGPPLSQDAYTRYKIRGPSARLLPVGQATLHRHDDVKTYLGPIFCVYIITSNTVPCLLSRYFRISIYQRVMF